MQTNRLFLREFTRELIQQVLKKPIAEQMVFLGLEDVQSLQIELNKAEKRISSQPPTGKKWHIIEQSTEKVIGGCGFHNWLPEHDRAELGYVLFAPYRGKKYMQEALTSVIAHGFTEM